MVMVFYEALCPDSKHFILKQLEPTFSKASSLIDFQLVPYGKATVCKLYSQSRTKSLQSQNKCNHLLLFFVYRQTQIAMVH